MYLVKYASSGIVAARLLNRYDLKDFIVHNDIFDLLSDVYIIEKEEKDSDILNIEKEGAT